jgi:hypothetical protein
MAGQLKLHARLQAQADGQSASVKVQIVAYTGGVIRVPSWGPVVIDLAGLELPEKLPLLADHNESVQGVIGTGAPQAAGGQLVVVGEILAETEAGRQIIELLRAGVPLGASVGVEPREVEAHGSYEATETLAVNGQTVEVTEPVRVVRSGILREVSITPVPADSQSAVSLAAKGGSMACNKQPEKERIAAILQLCGAKHPTLAVQAIAEGWSVEQTQEEALKMIRASRPKITGIATAPAIVDSQATLSAATLLLLGRESLAERYWGATACEQARLLGAHSAIDLCRAALTLDSQPIPMGRNELVRAAFSTTSLPKALGAAAEKILLDAYQSAPSTWRGFTRSLPATSFREHTAIRLAGSVRFDPVAPGGEMKHGTLAEESLTYRVETFGKLIRIDRQAIVNDDLGILDQVPAAFGRAAARKVSDLLYTVLLGNAGGFFSSGHNNLLTGGGSALSVTSLAQAIAKLRRQTDSDNLPLDLVPRVLLVPPSLEATARQLLNSMELARNTSSADQLPVGNPLAGLNLELAVEPRLENDEFVGASATAWYLLCGPSDGAFLLSFLNGVESPTIEQVDVESQYLGIGWRAYIDAGAAQGDWRCAVKANGV